MLYIQMNRPLRKGSSYELHMDFEGKLEESLEGLYLSKYKNPDGDVRYVKAKVIFFWEE